MLQELAWWSILIGNVLAAVTMGVYMWRAYPELAGRLRDDVLWASS
jgi:hypothetical protein